MTGVLLIFLNDEIHQNTLFWHEVRRPTPTSELVYGPELNTAVDQFSNNFSLRIDVQDALLEQL